MNQLGDFFFIKKFRDRDIEQTEEPSRLQSMGLQRVGHD